MLTDIDTNHRIHLIFALHQLYMYGNAFPDRTPYTFSKQNDREKKKKKKFFENFAFQAIFRNISHFSLFREFGANLNKFECKFSFYSYMCRINESTRWFTKGQKLHKCIFQKQEKSFCLYNRIFKALFNAIFFSHMAECDLNGKV